MLNIQSKLENYLQGNYISIYPVVVIGGGINDEDWYGGDVLRISTIKEKLYMYWTNHPDIWAQVPDYVRQKYEFHDYNLKISNLKDSMDIKNHKFKTSNLTFTLSNYKRISDNKNLTQGKNVDIYYKMPEEITLTASNLLDGVTIGCVKVYSGKIKKVEYDDKTIKLH